MAINSTWVARFAWFCLTKNAGPRGERGMCSALPEDAEDSISRAGESPSACSLCSGQNEKLSIARDLIRSLSCMAGRPKGHRKHTPLAVETPDSAEDRERSVDWPLHARRGNTKRWGGLRPILCSTPSLPPSTYSLAGSICVCRRVRARVSPELCRRQASRWYRLPGFVAPPPTNQPTKPTCPARHVWPGMG